MRLYRSRVRSACGGDSGECVSVSSSAFGCSMLELDLVANVCELMMMANSSRC